MRNFCALVAVGVLLAAGAWAADEAIIIPVVTDPSPTIDGDLGEWARAGVERRWERAEQVGYGREGWQGVADLSGWVRVGYDTENVYIVAHVVDSVFSQNGSGIDIWKGDHILGFLDFIRSGQKADMIQFGISPGNLKAPDDPAPEIKPEFVIWEPPGTSAIGATVAAKRTAEGYDIECAIPWKLLSVTPTKHQTLALELALSDCDTAELRQESCMSISTRRWYFGKSDRLILAGLADRTGHFPPDAFQDNVLLAKSVTIPQKEQQEFTFEVKKIPEGRVPTLTFKARMNRERAGGCTGALLTHVNGTMVHRSNIANRPPNMQFLDGRYQPSWYRTGIVLYYSPDFDAIEKTLYKPLDCKACEFTLRLDDLIKPGKNTITFKNTIQARKLDIVMADLEFSWSPPSRFKGAKDYAPAPKGPVPVYEPWAAHRVDYKVAALEGGALRVSWHGKEIVLESRFSKPGGGWSEWTADKAAGWDKIRARTGSVGNKATVRSEAGPLRASRTVTVLDECILVRDTLVNGSKEELPLKITHRTRPGPYEDVWLSGRPMPLKTGATMSCENPSVVVLAKETGFALLAHDDVFRVHCRTACDGTYASITDRNLVLRPGVAYEHEWLIVPLPKPDYWHYVNAARRFFKTNFPIEGSFAFIMLRDDCQLLPWELLPYLERKSVRFASVSLRGFHRGLFPHGPVKRECDPTPAQVVNTIIKTHRPQAKTLSYFNCFDCARRKDEPVQWPDCRVLRPDGGQAFNGPTYPLYFPTLTNAYGKEMDKNVDWLLNTVGADGLYWDCSWSSSAYTHYGEPWDGWSADLDPQTHKIVRKKSNLALLSWPWREKLMKRLEAEGRPLVTNRNPATTSAMKFRFMRFVETADISALCRTHLYTPIALGDHITERNEVDSYRWMLNALDWGGLYYWYSGSIIPTRPTLTSRMFPFTPIELHSGYLIGEERILTNKSGLFGWGDLSEFDVYVFSRVGKETDEIKVPRIIKDGKAYAEVRIPEGYSVALVRK